MEMLKMMFYILEINLIMNQFDRVNHYEGMYKKTWKKIETKINVLTLIARDTLRERMGAMQYLFDLIKSNKIHVDHSDEDKTR
jgi:hypothetical protein